jgi:hypothetical protein
VRLALRLVPLIAIAMLAAALFATRARLAEARLTHTAEIASLNALAARAGAAASDRARQAADTYAERTAALQPIIVRSTNEVTRYAETPAGRVLCRDADRVRRIDELDASLRAAATPGGGGEALHVDPTAPPTGR